MVWGDAHPSGRERAIETLIDREPQGAFYRAARVLDEVVPQALLNRPNVVTKGALVEQANSLSEYEIDLSNYDDVFVSELSTSSSSASGVARDLNKHAAGSSGSSSGVGVGASHATSGSSSIPTITAFGSSSNLNNFNNNSISKERILRHHAKQCSILQQQQRKLSNKTRQATSHSGASLGPSGAGTTATTPSPQLVAALRQVYGNAADDASSTSSSGSSAASNSFNFPALLKSVMDHKVFEATNSTNAGGATTKSTSGTDPDKPGEDDNKGDSTTASSATTSSNNNTPPAIVESLIANVCRLMDQTTNSKGKNCISHKDHQLLQGLLVASLSVLTQTVPSNANSDNDANLDNPKKMNKGNSPTNTRSGNDTADGSKNKNKGNEPSTNKKATAEDPPVAPALQVGSLLSLLKMDDGTHFNNTTDNSNSNNDLFFLDPELIDYFGQAAVAYEGRIEIQKARLLAKLQQDAAAAAALSAVDSAAESEPTIPGAESPVTPVALTTPRSTSAVSSSAEEGPSTDADAPNNEDDEDTENVNANENNNDNNNPSSDASTGGDVSSAFADQVAILEEDAAGQLERLAEATLTSATALERIINAAGTGDETSSGPDDEDADADADASSGSGSGSGSESDEEDNESAGGVRTSIVVGTENEGTGGEVQEPAPGTGSSPATDDEADGQEDEESSSSSSGDDWAMMQARAAAMDGGEQQGDVDDPDDDEDDDVLQQALALSLNEHNQVQGADDNGTENGATRTESQEESNAEHSVGRVSPTPNTESAASHESEGMELSHGHALMEEPTRTESNEDEEDELPPLPSPPSVRPYATLLGHPVDVDSDQAMSLESMFAPYFDPSALGKFGSIPTVNVLIHLLRYTLAVIENSKTPNAASSESGTASDAIASSVPGGMGTSLFPPQQQAFDPIMAGSDNCDSSDVSGAPVTLQLLVVLFLQVIEKRNEAIMGLRKALSQEERQAQGDDADEENAATEEDSQDVKSPLSSEEEDDPAIALAMNYAEDAVTESAESLEAKGMMRKAAAAAHDAAAVLNSLRRRTESWKENVKFYSLCALYALKSMRMFLQSTVRQRLHDRRSKLLSLESSTDITEYLPALVGSKLSMSLASLMSISSHSASAAMFNENEVEMNDVLLPLTLYKEAVTTWGECVPLVYPSVNAQVEILRNLISECSPKSGKELALHIRPLESLSAMPSQEFEPQVHRLQHLCKRLRVADMLDALVASPACYIPDAKSVGGDADIDECADDSSPRFAREPFRSSGVVSLIASAAKGVCGGKGELQRLFLALCHRFHSRVLLWGGLYESSESDVDDVTGGAVAQASTAPGDLVRISANPSTSLQFDATKCSDSIAILGESSSGSNGSSVHQRASKVWGAVLSTHHYSPKTGVHRWAVRLDKCERGHVFVGVATSQASMRTYVGGDKYGWGMIGTQALWHDRRKIRGDYGATFRTGSTIIVTLDTDAGTLSFSSWKDSSSSSSFSLDPLLQNQSAARRHGHIGGTVEEWGVAFEGLPLDSRLYPAVGLYQRDDRVTLLTVENSGSAGRDGALDVSAGICYYPIYDSLGDSQHSEAITRIRRFNDTLSWEGVQYVLETLQYISTCLAENNDEFVLATLLPSLSASLCLVPNSIPVLSERFALTILPHLANFLLMLDRYRSERQIVHKLFRTGMRPGKWIIRATGSSVESSDYEEYVVDFSSSANEPGMDVGFEGTGVGTTGKSKNGLVTIFGTTKGSSVHFVEEWSDGGDEGFGSSPDETSSCVVAARLSLDGTKFEGTYRNVQFGTTGQIAGFLRNELSAFSKFRLKDAPASSKQSAELADGVVMGEAVLCLAYNHMATIIGEDAAGDQVHDSSLSGNTDAAHESSLKKLLNGKLLGGASLGPAKITLLEQIQSLRQQYLWGNSFEDPHGCHVLPLLDPAAIEKCIADNSVDAQSSLTQDEINQKVDVLYERLAVQTGGMGSLRSLCSEAYDEARKRVIGAFIAPCNLFDDLSSENTTQLEPVWQVSLRIMEDGLRRAMSNPTEGQGLKESCSACCDLFNHISSFLSSLEFWDPATSSDAAREITSFYKAVDRKSDLEFFRKEMEAASRRSILRFISVREVVRLLLESEELSRDIEKFIALEALVVGLPRLLGRSPTESLLRIRKQNPNRQDGSLPVESHALFTAGSDKLTRRALQSDVHKLFELLGRIAARSMTLRTQLTSSEAVMPVDSLVLSVLTVFTITLKDEIIDEVVHGSKIIERIQEILSQHGDSVAEDCSQPADSKASVVKTVQAVCQREISRSVVSASVAVAHAVIFQTAHRMKSSSSSLCITSQLTEKETATMAICFELLFGELKKALDNTENIVTGESKSAVTRRHDDDWERWREASLTDSSQTSRNEEKKGSVRQVGGAGLLYLLENGTTHSCGLLANSQKTSSRQKSTPSALSLTSTDSKAKFQSGFTFQLLSQWLHILCGVLNSPLSLAFLKDDPKWISLLLNAAGLSLSVDSDGRVETEAGSESLLPGRFRSRIMRFLLPLLETMEPNDKIVLGLMQLAGRTVPSMPPSLDEDEKLVSREAVTLLRQLHSPARPAWREVVNRTILTIATGGDGSEGLLHRLGLLSFVSGSLEAIDRGSYVLLKPAAAIPLSVDQQASPSNKGHSSGAGGASGIGATPHHIVGNGTEGVVAGLCRHDAAAGLISNIDMKNGICEVVLLSRNPDDYDDAAESLLLSNTSTGSATQRHSLTVRALRTALSDVVHAQEAPLYLDETMTFDKLFGSLIEPALESLFSAMKPNASLGRLAKEGGYDEGAEKLLKGFKAGLGSLAAAIMLLRSAIVILSDKRIATTFLKSSSSKAILARILRLALPSEIEKEDVSDFAIKAQRRYLSALPVHEARYGHLVELLRELSLRDEALGNVPQDVWVKRIEELKVRLSAKRDQEEKEDPPEKDVSEDARVDSAPSDSGSGVGRSEAAAGASSNNASATDDTGNRNTESTNRGVSQSTMGSGSEDEEENEAAATAAAHLREAAIAQMAELGLPRSWSELALRRTGGNDIEAAVHFCLERGGEMERLLAEERERERLMQRQAGGGQSSRRRGYRGETGSSNHLLRQLLEMGFPSRWCAEALAATGNNVDEALTWILTHGERLSEEDEAMEDEDDGEDVEDDEDDDSAEDDEEDDDDAAASVKGASAPEESAAASKTEDEEAPAWSGSVVPLRFISGRSNIDSKTLSISGLPTGGFSSVGTKGVLLCSGKWYYEAVLETAGCLQIGWADGSFAGHCHADRGDGTGDGPSSWAFDGWRRYRWHSTATEWGCRWKEGDVVGCLVDMDEHTVSFTLNGRGEEIGMGVAFAGEGFRPCGGVYACVSFNRREKLRLRLSEPFQYQPPPGYKGVGESVLEAVEERETLALKEDILDRKPAGCRPEPKRFLCDFSDGEHGHELMAWAHRYYGSDASVHLGSGRSKPSGSPKSSSVALADSPASACISRRLEKVWTSDSNTEKCSRGETTETVSKLTHDLNREDLFSKMQQGYAEAGKELDRQLVSEAVTLAILFSRKLVLHLLVTMGEDFDPACFLVDESEANSSARLLWGVIEACASLRCAGWVGEAGAMAIAAEALGLGISSNDHGHSRQSSSERAGIASAADLDEGVLLPAGGITQLLSSVMRSNIQSGAIETGSVLAACAEAAFGSDGGGGVLVFLQKGLQSAVCKSHELRCVLAAAVRRSIRLLAVVEYEGDDSDASDPIEDDPESERGPSTSEKKSKEEESDEPDVSSLPDARLTSFFTGLLMSKPVEASIDQSHFKLILQDLFQAWSIGMLSASLPWRMVCAFTVAGILNKCPEALLEAVSLFPTLARYYGRLESTVARRVWAERAAVPVCSRYVQAMIELLSAVKRAASALNMPPEFHRFWGKIAVDAATPLPTRIPPVPTLASESCWESEEGWISSDTSWEVWTGSVEYMAVDWDTPSRSPVRSLMDGGEGPPMLREGCYVMRGTDWSHKGSGAEEGDDDGKKLYEAEKAKREKEKRRVEDEAKDGNVNAGDPADAEEDKNAMDCEGEETDPTDSAPPDPAAESSNVASAATESSDPPKEGQTDGDAKKKQKKKKIPSPKLPFGTVLSIEPWNGQPGLGRKIRWNLTEKEGIYRYGGDGGRYDICHVEINEKHTRVKKKHPLPESAEQCAARHGFGANKKYSLILRLRRCGLIVKSGDGKEEEEQRAGILELPDFGAGIRVDCTTHADGAISVVEKDLVYGSKDSGWEARFGQPSFVPGSAYVLNPTVASNAIVKEENAKAPFLSFYEELLGSTGFQAAYLRNKANGEKVRVTSEMRLFRGRKADIKKTPKMGPVGAPTPPPINFDRDYHANSLSLSRDGRTVSCVSSDGRGAAYASVGFTKGVHYWEVKLEQADIGSVFIGVAEKPNSSGSGGSYDTPPRLNRWPGWGFVNFRATYSSGAERVYGAHCHAGDTVGVLLDCDAGRVSFFFDGLKYGEHILNDLGCAFENLSPFGFNVDGCGSGGAGQGAPSGIEGGRGGRYPAQGLVRPRALWPVVGLRNQGDRVTISPKWTTSYGVDGITVVNNVLKVDEVLASYADMIPAQVTEPKKQILPEWFIKEAFSEYQRWHSGKWKRAVTRGSGPYRQASFGLDVDIDASDIACATASAALGLKHALLAGDRVRLLRSAGRILELAEEALILGAHGGRLYYQIVSQKSEGGSLTEGGGRAWFLDESEVVDGLPFVGKGRAEGISLPLMDRFKCKSSGGLKISYEGGAVIRSDLEIIDGSVNLGVIPVNTVIPKTDVKERRVNSCGVTRYKVRAKLGEEWKEGWISARIRGGKEEAIVQPVQVSTPPDPSEEPVEKLFPTALECALAWKVEFNITSPSREDASENDPLFIPDIGTFKGEIEEGTMKDMSAVESDSLLAALMGTVSNFSDSGDAVDCSFQDISNAVEFAFRVKKGVPGSAGTANPAANQMAASIIASVKSEMPPHRSFMARASLIRSLNRRARLALPWMSVRPCQEGSALFGGLCGHGASTERAGRTRLQESQELWVQTPSIATRIRALRNLFFNSVKVGLLQSITEATATPTPLSHDEYELPREIRTVRINRLRSRMAMNGTDNVAKRKYSVFAQLHNETKGWGGAALRRGYVAKGHGGQRRAFKVKLIGEGVNDYSGPYREAFTDAFTEVRNVDPTSLRGSLGVLDPTPNNSADLGENRDLFMFSLNGRDLSATKSFVDKNVSDEELRIRKSFSSLTSPRDEASREVDEALVFLGRVTGTAYRHGIPVDLPMPLQTVWKPIVEEESKDQDRLRELDELAFRQSEGVVFSPLVWWQQRMLNSFVEGMSNVLPVEILTLLDGEELRGLVCGNEDVDVDLLRSVVEYEGYDEKDEVIQFFWETLRELTNSDRKLFLQFVWARTRLPLKKSDFEAPFKIQRDSGNTGGKADAALPSASTCFFSLALPEYTNKSVLKDKLLFAINNVTTMETDFQTNSAEIAEGYRAF